MYIIFDTETTGLPTNWKAPLTDFEAWPRLVQLAWQRHDCYGGILESGNHIIKPDGWEIPPSSEKIHGISEERAHDEGKPLAEVLNIFHQSLEKSQYVVGHNIKFDLNVVGCEYLRLDNTNHLERFSNTLYDTTVLSTEFCKLEPKKWGQYKWPKLTELYQKLFDEPMKDAHDAAFDVEATARSFFALVSKGIVVIKDDNDKTISPKEIKYQAPRLDDSNFKLQEEEKKKDNTKETDSPKLENVKGNSFSHLHVHTDYSALSSSNEVTKLVSRAKELKMKALAITDFGTLSGAFQFVETCNNKDILPIVGCELYWSTDYERTSFTGGDKDERYSMILLAKNNQGYKNLCKLSSIGNIKGFYYVPRVSKALIEKHKEGLIMLSGNIKSEIPNAIYNKGKTAAEKAITYWKSIFGEDLYFQINRLGLEEEDIINKSLLEFSKKHNIKTIACNESYYLKEENADLLDILSCIKTGNKMTDAIGDKWSKRSSLKNKTYYFKSKEEMGELFKDIPEAIDNISEIVSKVEKYPLKKKVRLPKFEIPDNYENEYDYLKFLTFEGAKERYQELNEDINTRINYELNTIKKSGYPGYFLIVQDFIAKAREMDIDVGPGRGSAAGSVVAYCLKITNIDPLKYGLLFERFLNPDRISLPDMDIDFDDTKRGKVINYVTEKYGKENVCQIITFGRLKTRSAIKDVGRVLNLSFAKTTQLADDLSNEANDKESIYMAIEKMPQYKKLFKEDSLEGKTLKIAAELEGLMRNTGVHACGVIIAPEPISNIVPITKAKDAELWITQYDAVEEAGLLKMDILGLKTLSIIRDALNFIESNHNIKLDIDAIPLNDKKTFNLFQRGLTNGLFQFESEGMRKHLITLKPDQLEDLIALNALFRPGPMQYIPSFIRRKQGTEKITYDLPEMEEILKETQGITVYQEQVMLLSQKLAGFTGGQADTLRKAMGKKNKDTLEKLKDDFLKGCMDNGHSEKTIKKIWQDWEEFANYAFNKSHSTCYAYIAYQTAYLKANYPEEYMTSVMKHNSDDLKKLSLLILDCKKMGIHVLQPHVNYSNVSFSIVGEEGNKGIRFGLEAVKGIGEYMSNKIVEDRIKNGPYSSLYDFCSREAIMKESLKTETIKRLVRAGIFDNLNDDVHRKQLLNNDSDFITKVIKNAERIAKEKASKQQSLFGNMKDGGLTTPKPPVCTPYTQEELEQMEYEQFGTYLSSHPLDSFKWYLDYVLIRNLENYNLKIESTSLKEKQYVSIAGLVLEAEEKQDKRGSNYLNVVIADFYDKISLYLYESFYNSRYKTYKNTFKKGEKVFIEFELSKSKYLKSVNKNILSVRPLKDVVKNIASLNIEINTHFVSDNGLKNALVSLLRDTKYSGQVPLYISIYDEECRTAIKPRSKSVFLDITENFILNLEKIKSQCLGEIKFNFNIAT